MLYSRYCTFAATQRNIVETAWRCLNPSPPSLALDRTIFCFQPYSIQPSPTLHIQRRDGALVPVAGLPVRKITRSVPLSVMAPPKAWLLPAAHRRERDSLLLSLAKFIYVNFDCLMSASAPRGISNKRCCGAGHH